MKYRDNMTEKELAQFKREINEMEALHPTPEGWEDEMEILHKAGLNRGQP